MVKVEIVRAKKKVNVNGKTIGDLLNELGISSNTVLAIKNGILVNLSAKVTNDDIVKLYPVISGG